MIPCLSKNFNSKILIENKDQTPKKWFILAILIGSLVVIGASGSGVGSLLHSHGILSFPRWLIPAIGTIGHAPYLLGLSAIGGSFIVLGIYGLYNAKQKELKKLAADPLLKFGDNFRFCGSPIAYWQNLPSHTYSLQDFKRNHCVIRKNPEGKLGCAYRLCDEERQELVALLKKEGYQDMDSIINSKLNPFFGDNFDKIHVQRINWKEMPAGTYYALAAVTHNIPYLVRKTPEGKLECTDRLDSKQFQELIDLFRLSSEYKQTLIPNYSPKFKDYFDKNRISLLIHSNDSSPKERSPGIHTPSYCVLSLGQPQDEKDLMAQ